MSPIGTVDFGFLHSSLTFKMSSNPRKLKNVSTAPDMSIKIVIDSKPDEVSLGGPVR